MAEMNPLLKQYLESKLGSDYETEKQKELESAQSGARWGGLFSDLGDVIAGRQVGSGDQFFQSKLAGVKNKYADKEKKALAEYGLEKEMKKDVQDQEKIARESDPNSQESKLYQQLAVKMGAKPELVQGASASKLKGFSPVLEKMYEIESKKQETAIKRQENQIKLDEAKKEKMMQLQTPYGLANTADDAKKLKDADEIKKGFDMKLNELIQLRKDFGGEGLNREAVSRAKQLSNDLLLAYKDMAKLGVLSISDEKILNSIIPKDPLEYRSPLAAIQGQDPIMNNLVKFKQDTNQEFENKLANRLRSPEQAIAKKQKEQKTPVKTQVNKKTGQKRIVYSDGSTEVIDAVADGGM